MKKNNLQWIIILLAIAWANTIVAQVVSPDDNFDSVYQKKLNYVEKLADDQGKDIEELAEYKHFIIWANQYRNRVDENNDLSSFGKAMKDYTENPTEADGDFELNWEYNSPDSLWANWNGELQGQSGQGLIISTWVNPFDMNHIMAGGQYCGGLWETNDDGKIWTNLTEDYPQIQGVSSIFVDTTNLSDTTEISNIFITTTYDADTPSGYANGLFYTTDGGSSWEINRCYTIDPFEGDTSYYYPFGNQTLSPRVFLQNHQNDSIMYLLTPYRLLQSKNMGGTWRVIINRFENNDSTGFYSIWSGRQFFDDMVFDPVDPSILYVTGPEAFRLTNDGDSIENITDSVLTISNSDVAHIICVDAHPNYPDSIWFTYKDKNNNKAYVVLYNKTDSSYTVHPTNKYISVHYLLCEVSPKNPNHILIGDALPRCFDHTTGYAGYYTKKAGMHNDMRSGEWPDTGDSTDFVLLGTDGGLTKIYNFIPVQSNADNYNFKYIANDGSDGIRNLDIQGFDVSTYGEDIMVIGTSHDGMVLKVKDQFIRIFTGGDQQSVLIDPDNPNRIFATQYGHNDLDFSSDMGKTDVTFYDYDFGKNEFPPVMFFNPNSSKTLYVGEYFRIFKFNTDSLDSSISPSEYIFADTTDDPERSTLRVREYGNNSDIENTFFISTARYFPGWKTYWNDPSLRTGAFYRVNIDNEQDLSYTDLSNNLYNGLKAGPISGITLELSGTDTIVYASFGSTSSSSIDSLYKKVYYSKDLGETWFAMADSLPERIPVNDIKYHKSSGMLFLVNDIGVYYFDRSDSIWMNVTDNLPPMAYQQIRFSHNKNKILVGSQAKGIWQADLPCFNDSIKTTIDDSVTWNHSVASYGNIEIDSGGVLTVKQDVYMPTTAKVIVKRGGELIIDGGKFTNACNEAWWGIEVWGTQNLPPDSLYAHGKVILKNEAIVENARYGVRTIKMGESSGGGSGGGDSSPDYSYSGGKVVAYGGSKIRNCIYGVYFYPYAYDHASGFTDVSFITSDSLLTTTGKPSSHVYMNGVEGIGFNGCTFANTRDSADVAIAYRGKGIQSIESEFTVDEDCDSQTSPCPDSLLEPSRFVNLYYGIDAGFTTSNKFIDVRNAEFTHNWRGLYASAMTAGRITSNDFDINQPYVTNGGCGLYLNSCTGYWVEDNTFKYSDGDSTGIGLVVHNSGSANNEIYRNTFENLEQGISAQEQNRNPSLRTRGLEILCNDFNDCVADIFVPFTTTSGYGIKDYQGVNGTDSEDMAGNLFNINSDPPGDYDDLNNQGHYFKYVYPLNPYYLYENAEPVDYDSITVGKVGKTIINNPWEFNDGCPSQISSGGGGLKSSGLGYKEQLVYYTGQVEEMEYTLAQLIDGGDTEALNTEVEFSTPPETMGIYNELLNESPYLSETVVGSVIEKETVLPNAMVRDVMVANPHSATSDKLLEKLDERNNPMPNYMMAQVLLARNNVSFKEELESKLSGLKLRQARAFNGIVRQYLLDTINPENASDSLLSLFQTFDDKNIKYRLAMLHLQRGEYQQGNFVMNEIPFVYGLSTEELVIHNTMVDYYNLVKGIKQDGRIEMEATGKEIEQLLDIEETEAGIVSTYARNVLIALDEIDYLAPIQIPDLLKSKLLYEAYFEILNSEPPSQLSVFPNPSKDFVIIEYYLELEKDGIIEVKNVNGIVVNQVKIERLHDQVTVKTQNWKPGLYIATLKIGGKSIESCKFTLIK